MSETYLGTPPDYVDKWLRQQEIQTPFYVETPIGCHVNMTSNYKGLFSASKDGQTWEEWDNIAGTDVEENERLWLKANYPIGYLGGDRKCRFHFINKYGEEFPAGVIVGGNAISLLDNDFATLDYTRYRLKTDAFSYVFSECGVNLSFAGELAFIGSLATVGALTQAFAGCSMLVAPPRLLNTSVIMQIKTKPSGGLVIYYHECPSYDRMFDGCTALEKVRFPKSFDTDDFKDALYWSNCFGAVNAKAVFDL